MHHLCTECAMTRPESDELQVQTEIGIAGQTAFALTAGQTGIDGHRLADLEAILGTRAKPRHTAGGLMAENERVLRGHAADLPIEERMKVTAADTDGLDVEQEFARARSFVGPRLN